MSLALPSPDEPANAPAPVDLAVRARGVVRRFGAARALDGVDLEVRRGECFGLLGPNGAGKTTLVRILASLLAPSAGEATVLGLDPRRDAARLRARIGLVPQEVALWDHLSAAENLAFLARLHGLAGETLARAVEDGLALAGLESRRRERVKRFSGGMRRRLNLAAALVHGPELVFLDEPTVGVDPQSRGRIFEMVEELRAAGRTVVYTSHALGEVERLCDRIAILDRGRRIAEGTLDELRRMDAVRRAGSAALRFASADEARRAAEALAGAGVSFALEEEAPGLEEVFLALTGRELRDGDG